ncbi:polysaccharide pyruvyl transferase family protein [Microcella frigidaquae]|uniref:Polysaccharide pyruvyl transferase WcaK-like protein n=1 Tax=Microcella frigidaquae TaxID=424758 RepID=A0A840XNW3_9MICO|nr:polysaccharide pyruvyl transferase family protein [Microcella frigidaquae]MBB5618517.1 polysaccharide pyruvyl transferase WcaK-like protein [Microcella frigidaquae]NHN44584.1 polysaccharide pyruvyl transferase family protein [Microcella frigidaquae]
MTTTVPAPRIAIIGSALSGNKGASAMLESSIATLSERIPGVRFTLFSMYPAEDRAQNEYAALDIIDARPRQLGVTINTLALLYRILPPLRPLLRARSRAIGALASSQVLLDQGGITFTDGREKFLLYNVASILPAMMLRVPVFKCAQAVGPFQNPINRWSAKRFLPRVHTLVTRGRITHEFAEALGLTNLYAGADYAFSLELDGTEQAAAAAAFDLGFFEGPEQVVGVSPSVVLQKKVEARGADYIGDVAAFIDELVASGRRVVLFPHSVRTGTEKTHNNDLPLCSRIHERLAHPEGVLFIDRELSSQTLRYLIGRCDYFVASRFHAMVSSLAMAVPTLVIGWSHKYQEVLEMFQLDEWAFGHDKLEPDFLRERFEALVAAGDEVRDRLRTHLPAVKARSLAQADLIAALVTGAEASRA